MKKHQPFASTRREFLQHGSSGVGLLSMSAFAPQFLVDAARADSPGGGSDNRVLVIIQLGGGNDGLNTIIPHEDDAYYKRRPTLGLRKYLSLTDYLGLNEGLKEVHEMYKSGQCAIINNVGYPNPNRSHFRSTDIYHMGSKERINTGWVGRYLDAACAGAPKTHPVGINMGEHLPLSFKARRMHKLYSDSTGVDDAIQATTANRKMMNDEKTRVLLEKTVRSVEKAGSNNEALNFLSASYMDAMLEKKKMDAILDGYKPSVEYHNSRLAGDLRNIAAFISKGFPTRVYYAKTGGYDTHAGQVGNHKRLLSNLSKSVDSFFKDLKKQGLADRVTAMTFSEFGRRIDENGSQGTDHGTLGPMFVFGPNVNAGFYGGKPENLADAGGDLKWGADSIDFRSVYSTLLQNWMYCPADKVFREKFEIMKFI